MLLFFTSKQESNNCTAVTLYLPYRIILQYNTINVSANVSNFENWKKIGECFPHILWILNATLYMTRHPFIFHSHCSSLKGLSKRNDFLKCFLTEACVLSKDHHFQSHIFIRSRPFTLKYCFRIWSSCLF